MDKTEKNEISHRSLALQKLKEFLLSNKWFQNIKKCLFRYDTTGVMKYKTLTCTCFLFALTSILTI